MNRLRLTSIGLAVGLAAAFDPTPAALAAQVSEADSIKLHEEARDLQRRFESYREERMVPRLPEFGGRAGCDDIVGRLCLRYGDASDREDPERVPEPVEVGMARVRLARDMARIADEIPGDMWILGQRVQYLVEEGRTRDAERIATRCGGGTDWWCTALTGYVLHAQNRTLEAHAAFNEAMEQMPAEERAEWRSLRYVLRPSMFDDYEDAADQSAVWDRLWFLSDPLYLVDGNDREVEHYARLTYARIKRGTISGLGMEWGDDLEEVRVRWGMPWMWTRTRAPQTRLTMQDNRVMGNTYSGRNRSLLPDADGLESPSDIPANGWDMTPDKPWSFYTVPYATDFRQLESQIARFRRGDSMLVVVAFSEEDPDRRSQATGPRRLARRPFLIPVREPETDRADQQRRVRNPFARDDEEVPVPMVPEEPDPEGPIRSALFLIDEATYERHEVTGDSAAGTFSIQVPNGRYIVSTEAHQESESRAWRTRHGAWQDDLAFGLAAVSDILVLSGDGERPETLEEAIPLAMSATRVASGEKFRIAWEMYGQLVGEVSRVTIGIDREESGIARTLGRFLRLLEPYDPIDLTFEDQSPERLGPVFRAVDVDLPELEPGPYTISIEIELSGREPMVTTRKLEIVP